MDVNWAPARVRRNFRIDTFSAICGGVYISVLITFMPIVVRRLGGSTIDVAIVIAAPFVGHLLSPISAYLLMGFPQVRVVAGTVTLARATFLAGVLVAATPLMLAMTTVVTFVISVANISAYTALMHRIYPDRERASAMAIVRSGGAIAGIAAAAVVGTVIDAMSAVSSATMIVAYLVWGRMIDRGSSIRLTLLNTVVTLLVPIGYIAAADVWLLIPVAVVAGIVNAGGEITFFTNIVQIAPRDKIGEYATAQSLLMGLRGTAAPFVAAALLGVADPRVVLLIGVIFMTAGCAIMAGAVRLLAPTAMQSSRVALESPAD